MQGSELREKIYLDKYKSDFGAFCKACDIQPALHRLKALTRVSNAQNVYPVFDTQFYVCKIEKGESDSLIMNKDEFTDAKWLTVTNALKMGKNGD